MVKTARKILIAILAVVCLACLTFSVACVNNNNNYYKLIFDADDGVVINSEVKSGASVQEGYEISFTLEIEEGYEGSLSVTVNDSAITSDENGVYKFTMTQDTTVTITGVTKSSAYNIDFCMEVEAADDEGNLTTYTMQSEWVTFKDESGEAITSVEAKTGDVIKFTIEISVYYEGFPFTVRAGSQTLNKGTDGYYQYTVTGNQTIAVRGLPGEDELGETSFLGREEGNGTEEYPFHIKTPFDLYYLAKLISTETTIQTDIITSYYVLDNDIDMKGDKLYVLGDRPSDSSISIFCGTFDGNGHTISNYYIEDKYYDYTLETDIYLNYIGLFGVVQPTNNTSPAIRNLNLENFIIYADGRTVARPIFAGGLVGYGMGVEITNCSVSGNIIVDGDMGYFGYVGGLIGAQESAYGSSSGTRYYSVIQSCHTDVDVSCESGYIYAAGGIVGYQLTAEERTASAVLNCYSEGDVTGAMRVGGITGQLGAFSSIKNCYATGKVEAQCTIAVTLLSNDYHYAYAGGIAGYAQYDGIISNSFFTGTVYSSAVAGNAYAKTDGIVSEYDRAGTEFIQTNAPVIYKCYSTFATTAGTKVNTVDNSLITGDLGWADEDWSFTVNGKPAINKAEASKTFTVKVKIDGDEATSLKITDAYIPVSYWYLLLESENGELPEYVGEGSARTYGYYFDEGLTLKVPFGYIPTDDITFYAEYVDYTKVSGVYYIQGGEGKCFTLTEDGLVIYRDGALTYTSMYYYNGEYLILENTFFAYVKGIEYGNNYGLFTFKATVEDGLITIFADPVNTTADSGLTEQVEIYTKDNPLTAQKKLEGFVFGTYYDADDKEYVFNSDGTGRMGEENFTFTVSGDKITVKRGNVTTDGTINENGEVTSLNDKTLYKYDSFKGVWEFTENISVKYEFDGAGKWKRGNESGLYTHGADGSIVLDNGITAVYKDDYIELDGVKYYRENSFVGTWRYNLSSYVEITLKGLNSEGFGEVSIYYTGLTSGSSVYELNYEAEVLEGKPYIAIYNGYELYALLSYDAEKKTLNGEITVIGDYFVHDNARFCRYDEFKGTWSSEGGDFTLTFNGYGNYNLDGYSLGLGRDVIASRGEITLNGDLTKSYRGTYLNADGTLISEITISGKTYNLAYNGDGTITVTCEDGIYTLTKNN